MRHDRQEVLKRTLMTLIVAAVCCVVGVALLRGRLFPSPAERVARAAASLRYRASEARLSGESAYRPARPHFRGVSSHDAKNDLPFLDLQADLESAGSTTDLHAIAAAQIYLGEPEDASTRIEAVLQRTGADAKQQAALWNDLAVARLESVASGAERRLLVDALDAAERAWAADATDPSVAWTRALLLEKLNNRRSALAAWHEYLRLDADSPWALEARKHVAAASEQPSLASFTDAMKARLGRALIAGDDARAREIVRAFPRETRLHGEDELLPQWAEARTHHFPEDQALTVVRGLAKALAATSGDVLLADAVARIDAADPPSRDHIAAALVLYKSAREAYLAKQVALARERLATAETALIEARSPMAIWANVYRTASTYTANRFAEARQTLDPNLDPCVGDRAYHAACGSKSWIEGLVLVQNGHPGASLASYERGLAAFRAANDLEGVATVLTLRAETLDFMSATEEAWSDRMTALEMFADRPMSSRPLIWMTIAQAALRDHKDHAAAAMFDEIAADARANDESMWRAEGILWRLIATNRIAGSVSEKDIEAARAAVAHIENPSIRERSEANLGLVIAEVRGSEPAARGDLDKALDFYRNSDDRFNGTAALSQRAKVRATMADFEAAGADLVAALDEFQRQSAEIADPLMRTVFSDRSRELFVSASKLQAARGNAYAALWLSDRARESATHTFHGEKENAAASRQNADALARQLVRGIPPKVTVVHQDFDGDELRTWVMRDGDLRFVTKHVDGSALRADLTAFRRRLQHAGSDDEVVPAARHLYDILLRPVGDSLGGGELLVYSPSLELRGLPASALHDGEAFLFERRPVAVTRSVSALTQARPQTPVGTGSVLIVNGSPAEGAMALEGVERESEALRQWYGPRAQILAGAQATPEAVLATVPRYEVIHLGAHGQTDRRPLQNAIALDSGRRLRAFEIMSLSLPKAPVVVLGACSTDDETTGRATLSLAGAFADAGAAAVVGSLWDVEDLGAMTMLVQFHKELGTSAGAADALRRAQLSSMRRHDSIAVWAAFQVHM